MMFNHCIHKGVCALLVGSALLLPNVSFADVTFRVDAGYVRLNNTAPALNTTTGGGALLLLVAAGGNNGTSFSNATVNPGNYVAGGDIILGAGGLNALGSSATTTFGNGVETINQFIVPSATVNSAIAGAYIELRFYPNITLTQYGSGTTPTAGTVFGAYNPLATDTNLSGNTTSNPDGGDNWVLSANGTTRSLNFITTDIVGGTQNPVEGYARFTVGATPIPEPSTYFGVSLMMLAGGWLVRRNRLQAA